MIAELDHAFTTRTGLAGSAVNRAFLWGPDISGTMTGPGGVGGLLSSTDQDIMYEACSDANGNLAGLVPVSAMEAGTLAFCKPCEVRIHACNIAPSFAGKIGSMTGCKVIYARGACSGRRPWKSGVGKEPGGNTPDNGFWQSNGGLPSTPTTNSFRP